jgi:hypothetical protein
MPLPEDETRIQPLAEMETELETEPNGLVSDGVQRNIMDQLRAVRDEQTAGVTCYIAVPGYRGQLKAEYGVLPTKEMSNMGRKVERQFKDAADRQLNGLIDILISACEGLFYVEEDGSLTALDPDNSGVPLTYTDNRTADFFKLGEVTSARGCLMGVFLNNEPSILAHGLKLSRWYEDTSKEVDESFLGE